MFSIVRFRPLFFNTRYFFTVRRWKVNQCPSSCFFSKWKTGTATQIKEYNNLLLIFHEKSALIITGYTYNQHITSIQIKGTLFSRKHNFCTRFEWKFSRLTAMGHNRTSFNCVCGCDYWSSCSCTESWICVQMAFTCKCICLDCVLR
jgi:hypothetical protein